MTCSYVGEEEGTGSGGIAGGGRVDYTPTTNNTTTITTIIIATTVVVATNVTCADKAVPLTLTIAIIASASVVVNLTVNAVGSTIRPLTAVQTKTKSMTKTRAQREVLLIIVVVMIVIVNIVVVVIVESMVEGLVALDVGEVAREAGGSWFGSDAEVRQRVNVNGGISKEGMVATIDGGIASIITTDGDVVIDSVSGDFNVTSGIDRVNGRAVGSLA